MAPRKLGILSFALVLSLATGSPLGHAAEHQGRPLNDKKFAAELHLDNGKPIKGRILFKRSKKAVFTAYDGTEVAVRVRPICAHGPDAVLDSCWPKLAVELDDLSSRSGNLIVGDSLEKKRRK